MRFSLMRKFFGRQNQPSHRRSPARFRPRLEHLEARELLSATIYVNAADAGAPIQDGSAAHPYGTVQQGVYAANPLGGDTVQVAAGTYAESILINRAVTIDGAQAGVDARGGRPAAAESILSLSTYGLQPDANNITIDGFKIVKAPSGSPNGLIQTYANADSFTLKNTILDDSARAVTGAVVLFGGGSHTNMVFSQDLFQDNGDASLYFGGTSGYDNLLISSNKFLGNSGGVFWASSSPLLNGVIQGNEFDGTVAGVPGVGDPLLNIGQSTNLTIENNNFHDMDYTAFQVGMNGGSIVNNQFAHIYADPGVGFGDAFQLWGGQFGTEVSTNVTIMCNTIHYNDVVGATNPTRGIRLRPPDTGAGIDGSTIHIHDNNFLNGGVLPNVPAIINQGDPTKAADATNNWWGTPAGPTPGSTVGNVNTTPWALAPCSGSTAGSILLLDKTGKDSLSVTSTAQVNDNNGSIVVDSNSSEAVLAAQYGQVNATTLYVTGTAVKKDSATLPANIVHEAPTPDPLASLPPVSQPATTFTNVTIGGNSIVTLQPGTYVGGITISGNAIVTLAPGIYYLKNGGFNVSGFATVVTGSGWSPDTGNGVLIYQSKAFNVFGAPIGGISVSGQASVNLVAPTLGVYQGIAIFEDRTFTAPITVSVNGQLTVHGTIYAASAAVKVIDGKLKLVSDSSSDPDNLIAADLQAGRTGVVTVG